MVSSERLAVSPPVATADGAASGRYGEIFDRGYKHYDGPRLSRGHAIWALIRYSIKRAMGIKKSWTAKVIPILLYTAVAIPAAVGIGLRAFADADIFDYVDFFVFIYVIEGIFVATVAPEMVCGDRRENVLPLYFSRAITRLDYILAKIGATVLLTLSISLAPVLVYWFGIQLLKDAPLRAMAEERGDLLAIVITGGLIAIFLGSAGLAISTFTGRKSIAVAVIIIGFLISTALAFALYEALDNEVRRYTVFLSPTDTIEGLAIGLFDPEREPGDFTEIEKFPPEVYAAYMLGVAAVATVIMYLRYRPNE